MTWAVSVAAGEALAAWAVADLVRPAPEDQRRGGPVRDGVDASGHLGHVSEWTSGAFPRPVELFRGVPATS